MENPEKETKKILVIDDDLVLSQLIRKLLEKEGYQASVVHNGVDGLDFLEKHDHVDLILLDWVMPLMNGIEFLKELKEKPFKRKIPVVMITGQSKNEDIIQGIESGVYYYLTKPFDINVFRVIVKKVLLDFERQKSVGIPESCHCSQGVRLMREAVFTVRTAEDATDLISFFRNLLIDEKYCIGVLELILNGIEHGNLEIGYQLKDELISNDTFEEEVKRRLQLQENRDKSVTVTLEKEPREIRLRIEDGGKGFDYKNYLSLDEDRIYDLHGRGITISSMIFASRLTYRGKGNIVEVTIDLT